MVIRSFCVKLGTSYSSGRGCPMLVANGPGCRLPDAKGTDPGAGRPEFAQGAKDGALRIGRPKTTAIRLSSGVQDDAVSASTSVRSSRSGVRTALRRSTRMGGLRALDQLEGFVPFQDPLRFRRAVAGRDVQPEGPR